MTILAYGADQVQRLERALYGEVPHEAIAASQADLTRHVTERLDHRKAARAEMAPLAERARRRLFRHIAEDDPEVKRDMEELKAMLEQRGKRRMRQVTPHPMIKSVPRVVAGSLEVLKTPPYDAAWTQTASGAIVSAETYDGVYTLAVQSMADGPFAVAAGVAAVFGAPAQQDPPTQIFSAWVNYSDV